MSGERHFAKQRQRAREASLKERRAYERRQRLDLQDDQLVTPDKADATNYPCVCGAASAIGVCDDCLRELGGEG